MGEKSATKRTRNFACVVYPESAPADWKEILSSCFVPCFISPLHDKDVNPTGEPKKPHYHVLLTFDNVKTKDQAKEIFDKIGGVGDEIVQSLRGYARYLCHLDNPEKYQYSTEDVTAFCGADYTNVIGLVTDKYKAIGEMIDFCVEHNIYSYAELLVYCRNNKFEWFRVLCDSGTLVMKEFIKSKYWSDKEDVNKFCNNI